MKPWHPKPIKKHDRARAPLVMTAGVPGCGQSWWTLGRSPKEIHGKLALMLTDAFNAGRQWGVSNSMFALECLYKEGKP